MKGLGLPPVAASANKSVARNETHGIPFRFERVCLWIKIEAGILPGRPGIKFPIVIVQAPFGDVSVHVVQSKIVGRKGRHRHRLSKKDAVHIYEERHLFPGSEIGLIR